MKRKHYILECGNDKCEDFFIYCIHCEECRIVEVKEGEENKKAKL